jgi:hypothetical protein
MKSRLSSVLVGNDRGDAHDGPHRFAGTDAERVRDVLVQTGGFSSANLTVLRDENADSVRRALIALNDRVRTSGSRPGTQVMLLVYYSGHADAEALHLGDTRFDLTELEQLVRGSAAQFRVLLVDACRSGALARVKGGTDAPPFSMKLGEQLDGQGVAFLTSSSRNEDAQESDELGGSFFTHYFVSGLRGAADFDGDGRVQLDEAYRYAFDATVRATSRTWSGTQHPGYRFELGGYGRLVLTEPQRGSARSVLTFPAGRAYLIFRGSAGGSVIGEVTAQTNARRMFVRSDRYFIRARASDHVLEGEVSIDDGQTLDVRDDRLRRIEYARLVRKGGSAVRTVSGPLAGYTMRTALKQSEGLCHGAFAGYAFTFSALSITPRLDMCLSDFYSGALHAQTNDYGGDVRLAHTWDLPVVSLDIGLSVGGSWLRQTFSTPGFAPARDSFALRTGIGAAATIDVTAEFYVLADAVAETYVFKLKDSASRSTAFTPSLAFRHHLGIGKQW